MGCRPSATSNTGRTSRISTMSTPTRRRAGCSTSSRPTGCSTRARYTFNTLNFLVARRRCAAAHGDVLRQPDGSRARRAGRALRAARASRSACPTTATASIFKLRPEARFHDGTPLTAADVAFSFKTYKDKGHPDLALALTQMTEAVARRSRDVPPDLQRKAVGAHHPRRSSNIPVVSKAFYEANPFDSSQINPPLGSGPYKVGRVGLGPDDRI